MKIAIAGAGAMGSRFGYMLKKTGNTVIFIDEWKEHVDQINSKGLLVETENNQEYCKIPAYLPEQANGSFDLVILFTKAMQLNAMLTKMNHLLTSETAILCLANGLGNIETIEKYSGDCPLYVGVTLWSSELIGAGHIKITGSGTIEFQPVNQADEAKTSLISDTLNQAGLNSELSPDVILSIWKKAAFNSVLNTYCAILNCNVGQFGSSSKAISLARQVIQEFVLVANKKGILLTEDSVLTIVKKVFDPKESGDHYPSMHQDIAKGRKTEIDYLNGAIAKFGAELEIATPTNQLLTNLVHAMEDIQGID